MESTAGETGRNIEKLIEKLGLMHFRQKVKRCYSHGLTNVSTVWTFTPEV